MRGSIIGGVIPAFLSGCATPAQTEAMLTRQAAAECAAKGGQLVKTETKTGSASLLKGYMVLTGECHFPGDPGYVTPNPAPSTT